MFYYTKCLLTGFIFILIITNGYSASPDFTDPCPVNPQDRTASAAIGQQRKENLLQYKNSDNLPYEVEKVVIRNDKQDDYLPYYLPGYEFWVRLKGNSSKSDALQAARKLLDEFSEKRVVLNNHHYVYPEQIIWHVYPGDNTALAFSGSIPLGKPTEYDFIWTGEDIVSGYKNKYFETGQAGDGLWREYREYNMQNSPLPYASLKSITADRDNNIWLSCGLDKTNMAGWQTYESYRLVRLGNSRFDIFCTANTALRNNYIEALEADDKGNLLMLTSSGIMLRDSVGWKLIDSSRVISGKSIGTVMRLRNNEIYLLKNNKIMILKNIGWETLNPDKMGFKKRNIKSFAIDKNGIIWIATNNDITVLAGKKRKIFDKDNSALPAFNITSIYIDNMDNKWIAAGNALYKYDNKSWTVFNFLNSALPDNNITAITVDRNGNKWLGLEGVGVAEFNENGIK